MSKNKINRLLLLIAVLAALGLSSCILSPDDGGAPPPPTPIWKDLTHKEDVVSNLVMSYKMHDITHYTQLLTDGYVWYNQEIDFQNGVVSEQYYDRTVELKRTGGMFEAAEQKYTDQKLWIDKLELTISTAADPEPLWTPMAEYESNPCTDCWQTTRNYGITAVFADKTLIGNATVVIMIQGTDSGGKTLYKILRIEDRP